MTGQLALPGPQGWVPGGGQGLVYGAIQVLGPWAVKQIKDNAPSGQAVASYLRDMSTAIHRGTKDVRFDAIRTGPQPGRVTARGTKAIVQTRRHRAMPPHILGVDLIANFMLDEIKYIDQGGSMVFDTAALPTNNFNISTSLIPIIGGTGVSERIGRKLQLIGIDLRMTYGRDFDRSTGGAWTDANQILLRYIILCDLQSNGSAPAYTDVFDEVGPGEHDIDDHYNVDNAERFVIYHDRIKLCPCTSVFETGGIAPYNVKGANVAIQLAIPLDTEVRFDPAGAITSGDLYLMCITNNSGSIARVNYNPRVWYKN